jgi:hypothetical protein
MNRSKAALLAIVWAIAIYFGKQRLLESLGHIPLVPSIALVFLLGTFFMIPGCVFLVSILFGD